MRGSPGPSLDQVWQDVALEELGMGAPKPEVEDYFRGRGTFKFPMQPQRFSKLSVMQDSTSVVQSYHKSSPQPLRLDRKK